MIIYVINMPVKLGKKIQEFHECEGSSKEDQGLVGKASLRLCCVGRKGAR
jgi:hypothetical protein